MDTMDGMLDMHALEVATEFHASYVLSWQLGGDDDGEAECSVHVLMKREGGVLLALPGAFLPEEIVSAGNLGEEGAIFGPSFRTTVPAVLVEDGVVSNTGDTVEVLVVDCLPEVLNHMRRHHASEEIVFSYDEDAPFNVPSLDALMPAVRSWLGGVPDLAVFYTPEEEDLTPVARPKRQPGRKATHTESGARPKRPTTAALAVEIQQLVEFMPKLSQQLADLSQRQDLVESRILPYQSASSVASQPLGKALDLQPPPPLGALAKAVGVPPRTATSQSLGLLASVSPPSKPVDVEALEAEKPGLAAGLSRSEDSSLAQAVLEQSRALTSLAAQIAAQHGDPMAELSGPTTGTRGAAGRAKLQSELALHRGTFFQAVLQQMARRMAPTSSADLAPSALLSRGISGLRYLERFGGYGRQRELGQLQFQVMTAFDYLMEENIPAAKDTIALLAVSIEQSCLDNGRMDLATPLCLQEDPPSAIFQNRVLSATSRARSFAPLADQRWVTSSLAFLKEMEVITSKRAELTGAPRSASDTTSDAAKPKAKAQPKRKGRGKGQAPSEEAEPST